MGNLAVTNRAVARKEPRLTDAVIDGMVTAARDGIPIETACAMFKLSKSAFLEWLRIGSGEQLTWHTGKLVSEGMLNRMRTLFEGIAAARAEREAEAVRNIREAGQTIGRSGVREWRADAWLLEHSPQYRDRWGQHVQVDQSVQVSAIHQIVRSMSDEELLELEARGTP